MRWTPVERRDTTSEAAAFEATLRSHETEIDRLEPMLRWCGELQAMRIKMLKAANPSASEAEIIALWTEQTYRGTVADTLLDRALAAIRSRRCAE